MSSQVSTGNYERCDHVFSRWSPHAQNSDHVKQDAARVGICMAMSLAPSQIIGVFGAIAAIAKAVFYAIKSLYHYIAMRIAEKAYNIQADRVASLTLSSEDYEAEMQKLQQLKRQLTGHEYGLSGSLEELRDSGRHFTASLLALVPLVGTISAGAFLVQTAPRSVDGKTPMKQICRAFSEYALTNLQIIPRTTFFPLGQLHWLTHSIYSYEVGSVKELCESWKDNLGFLRVPSSQFEQVNINVDRCDGQQHAIRCQYLKTDTNDERNQTMILFPGNTMVGERMLNEALSYSNLGWNVLTVTYGGYPGSDTAINTTPISVIQDVYSVINYLKGKGVTSLGVHGYSIGATAALTATRLTDIDCAVLLNPFDTPKHVVQNLLRNTGKEKLLPSVVLKGFLDSAFPVGVTVPGVVGKDGRPFKTDGLRNIDNVREYQGTLVTIGANRDDLMGFDRDDNGNYTSTFANVLYEAHRQNNVDAQNSFHEVEENGHNLGFLSEKTELTISQALQRAQELAASRG